MQAGEDAVVSRVGMACPWVTFLPGLANRLPCLAISSLPPTRWHAAALGTIGVVSLGRVGEPRTAAAVFPTRWITGRPVEDLRHWFCKSPSGPEDVASVVVVLASNRAGMVIGAAYDVTGSDISHKVS